MTTIKAAVTLGTAADQLPQIKGRHNLIQRTATVAGAFGAVEHSLVAHLQSRGDWRVIGLGRRQAPPGPRSMFVSVDLTSEDQTRSTLSTLPPADVVFFAAWRWCTETEIEVGRRDAVQSQRCPSSPYPARPLPRHELADL